MPLSAHLELSIKTLLADVAAAQHSNVATLRATIASHLGGLKLAAAATPGVSLAIGLVEAEGHRLCDYLQEHSFLKQDDERSAPYREATVKAIQRLSSALSSQIVG